MKKKSNRLLVKALGSNTALTRVSSKSNTIVSFSKLYKGSKRLLVEVFIKWGHGSILEAIGNF